jgi:hypothetical protein
VFERWAIGENETIGIWWKRREELDEGLCTSFGQRTAKGEYSYPTHTTACRLIDLKVLFGSWQPWNPGQGI